jgi:hypothetical protein
MDTKMSFMMKCVKELLNHGFSVLLHKKKDLNGYGGWFGTDVGEEEFVVAMDHHMGFEIFIHEYCHFLQWKYNREFWDSSCEYYDTLFDWIENPQLEVSEENLQKSLETILTIEHDCESRVLKLVELNPIENFDKDKYIRAVNSYLWSYHINKELRKRPKNPIYTERLLASMPNTFNKDINFYLDKNNLTQSMREALLVEYEINSTQA